MALQSSGTISLGNIRDEFGGTGARAISTYYRGGSFVPNHEQNSDIPTSGLIKFSDFYGAAKNFEASGFSGLSASSVGYGGTAGGVLNFTFIGRTGTSQTEILELQDNDLKPGGPYNNTVFQVSGNQVGTWWSSIVVTGATVGTTTFTRPDSGIYNSDLDVTTWTQMLSEQLFFGTEFHNITINLT